MTRIDRSALPKVLPPPTAFRTAVAARRAIERLHRSTALPLVRILEQTIAMVDAQATATFAELGVADLLEHGPRTAASLADVVGADPGHLDRLLRYLATRGVVGHRGGQFSLTAVSDLLRRGHPESLRDWVVFQGSAWQWHAWEHLTNGIVDSTTTPFERAHGRGFFDHLEDVGGHGAQFDAAMRSTSRLQGRLLADALDLSGVGTLCDVGGGTGAVLTQLLRANDGLAGILLDLPSVVDRAREAVSDHGVADRIDLRAGDMFEAVPPGADRYLLSAIIHDWPDDDAARILGRVREAMGDGSRAIVVELELPDHDGASLERAYDLLMLVLGGGRERTRAEFDQVFDAADLTVIDDTLLANGWHAYELAVARR